MIIIVVVVRLKMGRFAMPMQIMLVNRGKEVTILNTMTLPAVAGPIVGTRPPVPAAAKRVIRIIWTRIILKVYKNNCRVLQHVGPGNYHLNEQIL